ncbi:Clavaminate synthase-like protein, partial [Lophiostoma macrostomum CBS 122681]
KISRISLSSSTPRDVLQALSTVGFIHLELDGTNISQADVDRAFELSRLVYSVPHEQRQRFWKDKAGNGYFRLQNSLDERTTKPDLKETFTWGRYQACQGQSATSQQLPSSIEHCRTEMIDFDEKCFEASLRVLDILSEAFEASQLPYFRSTHKDSGSSALSFLNYPPPHEPPADDDVRAGSHKDWGDITLLFQEQHGQAGLQVYLPSPTVNKQTGIQLVQGDLDLESGSWISAPNIPGTVLVNVGLTLEGMTDGLCKATVHRVIFPPTECPRTRRSIAYFSTPSHDIIMNPVKPGGITVNTPRAPSVENFFRERMRL